MSYLYWLLGISAGFVLLERLFPWRKNQAALRPGWLRDSGFVALNGHLFSLWTAGLTGALALSATSALHSLGFGLQSSPASRWPFLAQFLAFLVLVDSLQWRIHNLLHRVPWRWTFHKVHHSITTMDWIGNWRFHWVGPLGYLLNSPRMHLWHHDQSSEGGVAKNSGIVLSLWDFIFETAYWPRERRPERLGYPGIEEMPTGSSGQVVWPLTRGEPAAPAAHGEAS